MTGACDFCKSRSNTVLINDTQLGELLLCNVCNHATHIQKQRDRAILNQKKFDEIDRYIRIRVAGFYAKH